VAAKQSATTAAAILVTAKQATTTAAAIFVTAKQTAAATLLGVQL
jgi:hypothetical protein